MTGVAPGPESGGSNPNPATFARYRGGRIFAFEIEAFWAMR